MKLRLRLEDQIETDEVIALYQANGWSSAEKPEKLVSAFKHSDALVTARISGKLVGLGNAISDGIWFSTIHIYLSNRIINGKGLGVP